MAPEPEPRYTLTELASLAGVTPRTVRYYISQGLLAVDATPGPGPKYDEGHLARLRLIKRLQAEHLPLAAIRHRLDGITDADAIALQGAAPPAPPADSALAYIQALTRTNPRFSEQPVDPPRGALLQRSYRSTEPPAAQAPPPAPTVTARSQWERIEIAPDIELHVRRPLTRATAKQVDRLIAIARDHFPKEQP